MQKLINAYKADPSLANAKRVFMYDYKHAFASIMLNAEDARLLQVIIARHNKGEWTMYTAQIDRHGNIIVCKGDVERSGYRIFFTGSYNECLNRKVMNWHRDALWIRALQW